MNYQEAGTPLPFEQCENFRDLGGYVGLEGKTVRYGLFFRAPALAQLKTAADLARFRALGVRTVFDFRSAAERRVQPDPVFEGIENIAVSAIRSPNGEEVNFDLEKIFTKGQAGVEEMLRSVSDSYVAMPFGNPAYQALFAAIAQSRFPLLFHCTAGKDRTGVAAALILRALGVSDEDIVADYLRTNECRTDGHVQLAALLGTRMPAAQAQKLAVLAAGVKEQSIRSTLAAIDARYDSFADYLAQECAFPQQALQRMREQCLAE